MSQFEAQVQVTVVGTSTTRLTKVSIDANNASDALNRLETMYGSGSVKVGPVAVNGTRYTQNIRDW